MALVNCPQEWIVDLVTTADGRDGQVKLSLVGGKLPKWLLWPKGPKSKSRSFTESPTPKKGSEEVMGDKAEVAMDEEEAEDMEGDGAA